MPLSIFLVKPYSLEKMIPRAAASSIAEQAPWDWFGYVAKVNNQALMAKGGNSRAQTHQHWVGCVAHDKSLAFVPVSVGLVNPESPG